VHGQQQGQAVEVGTVTTRREPATNVLVVDMDTIEDGALTALARRLRDLQPAMTVILVGRQAPAGMERLVSQLAARASRLVVGDANGLSARETQVLRLVGAGLTNKGIALRLGITVHTVSRHISNILHKLGAQNRAEAVRLAGAGPAAPPRR
jgi:DNA-binding NarL/FixJ family response regulator